MRMRLGVFLLILFAPAWAAAQSRGVEPGARIRFAISGSDSLREGILERLTPDSLLLTSCATCDRLAYNRAELRRLAVFRKTGGRMRTITGFGIGGLIGILAGALSGIGCHGDKCENVLIAIPFGGLAGGLIGSLVGYLNAYTWQSVTSLD